MSEYTVEPCGRWLWQVVNNDGHRIASGSADFCNHIQKVANAAYQAGRIQAMLECNQLLEKHLGELYCGVRGG